CTRPRVARLRAGRRHRRSPAQPAARPVVRDALGDRPDGRRLLAGAFLAGLVLALSGDHGPDARAARMRLRARAPDPGAVAAPTLAPLAGHGRRRLGA